MLKLIIPEKWVVFKMNKTSKWVTKMHPEIIWQNVISETEQQAYLSANQAPTDDVKIVIYFDEDYESLFNYLVDLNIGTVFNPDKDHIEKRYETYLSKIFPGKNMSYMSKIQYAKNLVDRLNEYDVGASWHA